MLTLIAILTKGIDAMNIAAMAIVRAIEVVSGSERWVERMTAGSDYTDYSLSYLPATSNRLVSNNCTRG